MVQENGMVSMDKNPDYRLKPKGLADCIILIVVKSQAKAFMVAIA